MAHIDGSVIIDTKMNNKSLEKGFEQLKTDCESLGIACEQAGDKVRMAFADYDVSAPIQECVAKLELAQARLQDFTNKMQTAIYNDDDRAAEMWANKYNAAFAQVEAAQRRLTQVIAAEANKQAEEEEKAQERVRIAKERATKEQEKAYKEATKGARKFGNRFSRIFSGALIFNAISSGLRQLTSYFSTALKKNSEFSASFAQLKGAFLTAAQPIYEMVVPALTYLMNLLTKVAQALTRLMSLLTGKSTSQMAKNAKSLYDQASATKAAGNAAEKAKKQIAGFDQINKLNDENSSSGSNSSDSIAANFEQSAIPEVDLDKMIVYTSGALLALGVILTFTGANIPLGIGLIAIGAFGLAEEIKENWGCMGTEVSKAINIVLGILAAAGLVIGAILVFSNANIPLGIGLMILGAATLAAEVAINWNSIIEAMRGTVGKIVAIVSAALLVIGAILAFSNATTMPLGIGLMAAGAIGLATVVAINWNSIVTALQGPIGKVVAIVSGALLVLGIILTCCGIFPLGIGLIIAGVAGLVTVSAVNWNAITQKVQEIWQGVKSFWNRYIAPIFTLSWWKNLAIKCGNGLIGGFEGAINGIITMFEKMINWIVNGLNKISFDVPDWVPGIGGKVFGFNIPKVSFSRVSIPRLAQGAVIPPNKEFMAVLGDQKHGTNVEAPLSVIQQAVAEVLGDQMNGMMAGFEALLAENRRLRAVVENIEVGDSTIGQAAARYQSRTATITGGL